MATRHHGKREDPFERLLQALAEGQSSLKNLVAELAAVVDAIALPPNSKK